MRTHVDVFLSYSRGDDKWVTRLADLLKKQGIEVWLDTATLRQDDSVMAAIEEGLKSARFVVFVLSSKPVSRPNVFLEAGMAIALGKDVTFIVPEDEARKGRLPIHVAKRKRLIRRSPAETARDLVKLKNLDIRLPEAIESRPNLKRPTKKRRFEEYSASREFNGKKRTARSRIATEKKRRSAKKRRRSKT